MNVVVEDDGADQDALAEENSLRVLESLAVFRRLDHNAAYRGHCAQAIGRVLQWNRLILEILWVYT